ncbi:MAG: ABC transporter ATP-binding protein [Oligoflexus sp.]|jgi:putative ABC transport system ATP-binding protein
MSIVRVQDLCKNFRQGDTEIPVLRGLNFEVAAGETVAIVGQSGSGKSTLLSLLAGLDIPTQGSIHIRGQNIHTLSQADLTRFRGQSIGIIFQQFHLMRSLTALENVTLPLDIAGQAQAETKAKEALERVGLGHRAHHLPTQLSGGECQRVAIARAFVVQPAILLADEPSGNLDTNTGDKVMNQLFDAVEERGMTMILVTHDMQLAARCQRRLTLQQGQIVP